MLLSSIVELAFGRQPQGWIKVGVVAGWTRSATTTATTASCSSSGPTRRQLVAAISRGCETALTLG